VSNLRNHRSSPLRIRPSLSLRQAGDVRGGQVAGPELKTEGPGGRIPGRTAYSNMPVAGDHCYGAMRRSWTEAGVEAASGQPAQRRTRDWKSSVPSCEVDRGGPANDLNYTDLCNTGRH
jgi:hypothetical protein